MDRRIPADYRARLDNIHFIDAPTNIVHQHHVYELLKYLARRSGASRIIDIGCGSADKLKGLDSEFEIICIEAAPMRPFVAENLPAARFIEFDLELGLPELDPRLLHSSIIICSDVIEHLRRPEVLLSEIARLSRLSAYVLISTPDRARARGLLDSGPPANPAHTMEWTADELGRFMLDCGFPPDFLIGYTLNNDHDLSKSTILAVAGTEATFSRATVAKSVAAIINVYNEADVLETVARHLTSQGVEVHIVDNWSTDRSYDIATSLVEQGICAKVIRYPAEPPNEYNWEDLLGHTAQYGAKLSADWLIHYDADELRYSPWANVGLADAISYVDQLGYTTIDFTVLNFGFTGHEISEPFAPISYKFFDFGRNPAHLLQIKAWKNTGQIVDLASTGGHVATFEGSRVFPLKFLNCHYPLRSTEQASRKVFVDRLPRVEREQKERGWHGHYNSYQGMDRIEPWRRFELLNFDPHVFSAEYLVERLSGIGIETEMRAIPNIASRFRHEEATTQARREAEEKAHDLAKENALLTQENAKLADALAEVARSRGWKLLRALRHFRSRLKQVLAS